ncbi:MAG: hypothetical protein COV34_02335 [Candidatus Zambryskibacteria bacterium CG10_big_fil_rev_8_21_14_0_10_42_12]|uniref:Penicillin-binding protein transpeptidase domain-containing protein n=1 Tax=Candidatus Zambryskibacteria bacterium CG10_big_fil_rev_8_21_14_0_10_42_12 TaxID=1975115 RepID=A0A2H0QVQ2_9BACT|nr:MAG: hypothetical protein COV34_02335 [Candidatus Zambryskibacteria bacterium CG10_big_fil_rev_8_21_14_0_10_42_12]
MFRSGREPHVFPEDVLMDSHNLPQFDTYQCEGRLVSPITEKTLSLFAFIFVLIAGVYASRLFYLQVVYGDEYRDQSEINRLRQSIIFAERGTIYDRNGEKIAWNEPSTVPGEVFKRMYREASGSHVLAGYISYPTKDANGYYYREDYIGDDGLEAAFNTELSGINGVNILETDALGNIVSEGRIRLPEPGQDLHTTIDVGIQEKMYEGMKNLAEQVNFRAGAGVMIDVNTGEVLALASYPEFNSQVMTDRSDVDAIRSYIQDDRNPFLNRAYAGVFTPGSIVKPFMALGALHEDIIDPMKQIYSAGSITIRNPYNPELSTVIHDWRAHGWTDMRRALAVSSNVYFFAVGGGLDDQEGLGITRINKYMNMFQFEKETGINLPGEVGGAVPDPEWKATTFPQDGDWRLGDTYNTAIGQYGFSATPIRAAVNVAAIANGGTLVTPTILKDVHAKPQGDVEITESEFQIVREGMRQAVLDGTARGLNLYDVEVAGKTGTAELGTAKDDVNSWVIGYFPYENPRYAFAMVMERGPRSNLVGATSVMRQVMEFIVVNRPEYIK